MPEEQNPAVNGPNGEEFNLFADEERLAAEAAVVLESGLPEHCAQPLARLLAGYKRLLRDTRQLVRLADRRERDLNRLNRKLETLTRSLAFQADHDALTGVLNKGAISERISQYLAQGECSLMLLDIDHFKRVNDTWGHLVGDQVLKGVVDRVQEQVREYDLLGRFGGEEFILLSRQTTLFKARALAERIRRAVEAEAFETEAGHAIPVTVSIGLTLATSGESRSTVIERADRAVYQAKGNGRNRVEIGDPPA